MTRKSGPGQDTRLTVLTRAHLRCEVCDGDLSAGMSVHHRKPRGMGGTRDEGINGLANLLAVCGSGTTGCHGWIEVNRSESRARGLLVYRNDDPEQVPFQDSRGRWWLLTGDGRRVRHT